MFIQNINYFFHLKDIFGYIVYTTQKPEGSCTQNIAQIYKNTDEDINGDKRQSVYLLKG